MCVCLLFTAHKLSYTSSKSVNVHSSSGRSNGVNNRREDTNKIGCSPLDLVTRESWRTELLRYLDPEGRALVPVKTTTVADCFQCTVRAINK